MTPPQPQASVTDIRTRVEGIKMTASLYKSRPSLSVGLFYQSIMTGKKLIIQPTVDFVPRCISSHSWQPFSLIQRMKNPFQTVRCLFPGFLWLNFIGYIQKIRYSSVKWIHWNELKNNRSSSYGIRIQTVIDSIKWMSRVWILRSLTGNILSQHGTHCTKLTL